SYLASPPDAWLARLEQGLGAEPSTGGEAGGSHHDQAGLRWWNRRHPKAYQQAVLTGLTAVDGHELLTKEDARIEALMLGLRLTEGLRLTSLSDAQLVKLDRYLLAGLLQIESGRVSCTPSGRLLADGIVRDLVD
ncbi:MAG: hypothetical protein LBV30_00060, partial [Propionibacteriaceae bacterium]|nr:hypothetical protein [Propionibacteriaceae bacterium]